MTTANRSPVETLLRWLSARGSVSRPTLDRACFAIAARFEPKRLRANTRDLNWRRNYLRPLAQMGHVEEAPNGRVCVVPPTLVWTAGERDGLSRFVLYGARDERLMSALEDCFGQGFHRASSTYRQAETWSVDGRRFEVGAKLQVLGPKIEIVDEPGETLLAALPPLETAIAAFHEAPYPCATVELHRLSDLSCLNQSRMWTNLARGENVSDGVLRWNKPGRSPWLILRGGVARELRTHEERAIGWWAELARKEGTRLIHDASIARLTLPASRLPPPVLVERALIWADGCPPAFDPSDLSRSYRSITRARAQYAARVLGMMLEEVR